MDHPERIASKWHKGQSYGNEPYIEHLRRVAIGVGSEFHTYAAGWLHDVLEEGVRQGAYLPYFALAEEQDSTLLGGLNEKV